MSILANYWLHDIPHKSVPLWHHKRGLSFTSSGYGRRIPSTTMVRLPGSKRWRRVYVCIYSNAGTAYVDMRAPNGVKGWAVISS